MPVSQTRRSLPTTHWPTDPTAPRYVHKRRYWHDSKTDPVQFRPVSRDQAKRIYRRARSLDRRTHRKGKHGGAVGLPALAVLEALVFRFLDCRTGHLAPSHQDIAAAASVCPRTVANALNRLAELRILSWLRRCYPALNEYGRWELKQQTNAYSLSEPDLWDHDGRPPTPSPRPWRETWVAPQPPDPIAEALADPRRELRTLVRVLGDEWENPLSRSLASLGRKVLERQDRAVAGHRLVEAETVAILREMDAKK
jgi:hypothetical protein